MPFNSIEWIPNEWEYYEEEEELEEDLSIPLNGFEELFLESTISMRCFLSIPLNGFPDTAIACVRAKDGWICFQFH